MIIVVKYATFKSSCEKKTWKKKNQDWTGCDGLQSYFTHPQETLKRLKNSRKTTLNMGTLATPVYALHVNCLSGIFENTYFGKMHLRWHFRLVLGHKTHHAYSWTDLRCLSPATEIAYYETLIKLSMQVDAFFTVRPLKASWHKVASVLFPMCVKRTSNLRLTCVQLAFNQHPTCVNLGVRLTKAAAYARWPNLRLRFGQA